MYCTHDPHENVNLFKQVTYAFLLLYIFLYLIVLDIQCVLYYICDSLSAHSIMQSTSKVVFWMWKQRWYDSCSKCLAFPAKPTCSERSSRCWYVLILVSNIVGSPLLCIVVMIYPSVSLYFFGSWKWETKGTLLFSSFLSLTPQLFQSSTRDEWKITEDRLHAD